MSLPFRTQALIAGAVVALSLSYGAVHALTQYLIYDTIAKGADPAKLATLKCFNTGETK